MNLYRNFRVHQIFGANTDVGKTIITSALCKTSAYLKKEIFYLKPVSTGAPEDADDGHVEKFSVIPNHRVQSHCLFRYKDPVSPHLAVQLSKKESVSDERLVRAVSEHVDACARGVEGPATMYIETAGGVHSPVPSGSTQANAYRPLLFPTILVGDSKLGGISSTISAYESLLMRGYQIDAVAMFRESYYRNHEYLGKYFAEQNISIFNIEHPPPKVGRYDIDDSATRSYYNSLIEEGSDISRLEKILDQLHLLRLENLDSVSRRTLDTIWWPFVQHGLVKDPSDVTVIDSAYGDFFSTFNSSAGSAGDHPTSLLSPKYDGSASWWTQALGHAHPSLTLAAARAAGRYGHVMFPQASHLPALKLAERLVHAGPGAGWASRAYFSDDGSTGMEVALKMAFRAFSKHERWRKNIDPQLGVLGLRGGYHGDTIGAMDACEEGIFTCEWHNAKGYWIDPPTVGIHAGHVKVTLPRFMRNMQGTPSVKFASLSELYNVESRLQSPLARRYRDVIVDRLSRIKDAQQITIGALVLEPLVMGAGGMIFVDPLFQRVLVDVVRSNGSQEHSLCSDGWKGCPVIFDEVFVGLYRLGMRTCSSLLGVNPDIAVYAKVLTGGLVPMAVTLANNSIYQAFMGETKAEALLHGHSYTAHPVGCEVANEALSIIERMVDSDSWAVAKTSWQVSSERNSPTVWSFWDPKFINALSRNPKIQEVMTLGTVLSFILRDTREGYGSTSAENALAFLKDASISEGSATAPFGIHFRTLGNVGYFMCSFNTRPETLRALEGSILDGLQAL